MQNRWTAEIHYTLKDNPVPMMVVIERAKEPLRERKNELIQEEANRLIRECDANSIAVKEITIYKLV